MDLRSAFVVVESFDSPASYDVLIIQKKGTASSTFLEGLYLFNIKGDFFSALYSFEGFSPY
jgi:hypothetical protein